MTENVKQDQEHIEATNNISTLDTSPTVAVAQSGNVAAAASLHWDQEYIEALKNCCVHNLRGYSCLKPTICAGQGLLCTEYHDGVCPINQLQHDSFLHIRRTCNTALHTGECSVYECKFGHDNLNIRQERWQQARRDADAEKADTRTIVDTATCEQIEALERAMRKKGTALDRILAKNAAAKLRRKMKSKMDTGEKSIRKNLRGNVYTTLGRYEEWVRNLS